MPSLNIKRDGPRLLSNIQVYAKPSSLTVFENKAIAPSSSCSREERSHMMKIFNASRVANKRKLHH
jgi:hypothetical protein